MDVEFEFCQKQRPGRFALFRGSEVIPVRSAVDQRVTRNQSPSSKNQTGFNHKRTSDTAASRTRISPYVGLLVSLTDPGPYLSGLTLYGKVKGDPVLFTVCVLFGALWGAAPQSFTLPVTPHSHLFGLVRFPHSLITLMLLTCV